MVRWQDFRNKRICVAISGGSDSVALLHFLKSEREKWGYSLSAAHCEHGIRGEESREDMRFTQSLCREWGIPLRTFEGDCPARAKAEKVSLETAARNFRYECFSSLLKEGSADYIALAHHRDDEAETALFRIARGASLTGAAAMRAQNGAYIRPLLAWSKEKIIRYIRENGLSYREDSTNGERVATRNTLRLEILPSLEEAIPGAAANIARFAALAAEDDALLYELSAKLLAQEEEGYAVRFCEKKPLFTRACLTAMKALGVEKDYTAAHCNALFSLQALERGAMAKLPRGVCAKKREEDIYIYREKEESLPPLPSPKKYSMDGFDGGRYEVKLAYAPPKEETGEWKALRFDEDKLPATAVFRFRKEGDEICRFGGGTKSLKKFFNEKKVPVEERECLPLLAEEEGVVYAVCGVEIAEQIKVDEHTRKTVYMTIRKKEI